VLTAEAKAVNFNPNMSLLMAYEEQEGIQSNPPNQSGPPNEDATILWVLQEDKSIIPKMVELGASDGVNVQIKNGIEEGDKLVYSLKSVSTSEVEATQDNGSPFMPKPPGRNNDKKK